MLNVADEDSVAKVVRPPKGGKWTERHDFRLVRLVFNTENLFF